MQQSPTAVFRFGPFEFSPTLGELRKSGTLLKLQPQPARLLLLLVSNPGEIVRREQIQQAVWGNAIIVDYDLGVNRCIRQIRSVLPDNPESPRYIKTIPRQGYSFIAPVEQIAHAKGNRSIAPVEVWEVPGDFGRQATGEKSAAELTVNSVPATVTDNLQPLSEPESVDTVPCATNTGTGQLNPPFKAGLAGKSTQWLLGSLAFILIATAVFLWVRSLKHNRSQDFPIRSLAIMPLQNLSNDPSQEYFADGMTEALTTQLAQDSLLRVISRTSVMRYKNTSRTLPEIAKELNVDGIIEGSVLRSENKIRITVQLLNAPRDQHLWANSFERDYQDVIRLQDEVSREIAAQIKSTLAVESLHPELKQISISLEAYEAYTKGRYLWNQGTPDAVKRSLAYFKQAVRKQPNYAFAYSGLADAYLKLGKFGFISQRESYSLGSDAALKSLELDSSLSQPHVVLGQRKAGQDWDWAGAEKEYRQALLLEPNNASAHYLLSSLLSILKRHDEAISETQKAIQLDPLSPSVGLQGGIAYYLAGRLNEAIDAFRKTLELNDTSIGTHVWLGLVYLHQKQSQAALAELQRAVEISNLDPSKNTSWFMPRLAEVYAATGKQEQAEAILRQMELLPAREQSAPAFALICIALGKREEAFQWLATGLQNRDMDITLLAVEPGYKPIRSEPRFRRLLQKMKFPE